MTLTQKWLLPQLWSNQRFLREREREREFHCLNDCTGNTEKHTRYTYTTITMHTSRTLSWINRRLLYRTSVLFSLRFAARHGSQSFLACIKLFPTEGNSDRLQGFIRQTLINLIIDHRRSQPVHEIKRRFWYTLLYYLRKLLGTFAVTQCLDIIRGITLYIGPDITPPPQSRAPLVKAICHVSNIKYASEQISRRVYLCMPIYVYCTYVGTVLRTTKCNV